MSEITWLTTPAGDATNHLVLAHGAGAPMDSPFLTQFADAASDAGLNVHRFEFAYMAERRSGGKKRPPPRIETLLTEFETAIAGLRPRLPTGATLLIGGKSMGGRAASMIADRLYCGRSIAGLICLGYPFHPQGKPEQVRTAHLAELACPTLILQGTRDPFGSEQDVADYDLSPAITVSWVGDGDHDFGPRGRSGFTKTGNICDAAARAAAFARTV